MTRLPYFKRGGCILAAALALGSATGCVSLGSLEQLANRAPHEESCPACGAKGDQPCSCRPDATVGGFKATTWVHYSPNEPAAARPAAALATAEPVLPTAEETAAAAEVKQQPEAKIALAAADVPADQPQVVQQAAVVAEPAQERVQLVGMNDELPPELMLHPTSSPRSAHAERSTGFRASHWRQTHNQSTKPAAGRARRQASAVKPSVHVSYQAQPASPAPEQMPMEMPQEDLYAPHTEMASCQSCADGMACESCETCPPSGYLLDQVLAKVKEHIPHRRHRCAGPPDPFCYGYKATHWRQMGDECVHPGIMGIEIYSEDLLPIPHEMAEEVSPVPPRGVPTPADIPPPVDGAPTPPTTLPEMPPMGNGQTGPAAPGTGPGLYPERPDVEPRPEDIPDLFPHHEPEQKAGNGVVKFSPKWRSADPHSRSESQPRQQPALRPLQRTSAAILPIERRELRFVPTKPLSPIAPATHEAELED